MSSALLLLLSAIALLLVEVWVWSGLRGLRRSLRGRVGFHLTDAVYGLVSVVVVVQTLALVNAALILYDRDATVDVRIGLFIIIETAQALAVVWAARRLRSNMRRAKLSSVMVEPDDEEAA